MKMTKKQNAVVMNAIIYCVAQPKIFRKCVLTVKILIARETAEENNDISSLCAAARIIPEGRIVCSPPLFFFERMWYNKYIPLKKEQIREDY